MRYLLPILIGLLLIGCRAEEDEHESANVTLAQEEDEPIVMECRNPLHIRLFRHGA